MEYDEPWTYWYCESCDVKSSSVISYNDHIGGNRHKAAITKKSSFFCQICRKNVPGSLAKPHAKEQYHQACLEVLTLIHRKKFARLSCFICSDNSFNTLESYINHHLTPKHLETVRKEGNCHLFPCQICCEWHVMGDETTENHFIYRKALLDAVKSNSAQALKRIRLTDEGGLNCTFQNNNYVNPAKPNGNQGISITLAEEDIVNEGGMKRDRPIVLPDDSVKADFIGAPGSEGKIATSDEVI